ncbi:16053_t:CDS:2, partial [Rhizophagus irregularis]
MTLPTFNIDIIFEIINELKDDGASLFNFLLLNKQICELTIPILWENPFKLCNIEVKSKHYLIIQTYINCLNEDDYKKFISILKRGFKDHKNEIPLLFEYGKYLKEFNIRDLYNAVSTWQSQKLNCLNWNIGFNDENLLEIMQHKIKDLDYLTLYCDG